MKTKNVFLVFLLSCQLFAGCNKNNDIEYIIGEWKLNSVTITDESYQPIEMDLSDYNIIYEFKKNNRLVITSFVSEKSAKSSYSYKGYAATPEVDTFNNLQIDGIKLTCYVFRENGLIISGFSKMAEPIDDIDLAVIEKGGVYWEKSFVKLK